MKQTVFELDEPNVVDFHEAVQAKASASGGGFDYFPGMTIGSRFACIKNGTYGSMCDEYILLQKSGPSVLLLNTQINAKVHWATAEERHVGQKFWKMNTMVQILHDPATDKVGQPPPKVESKDNNNGKRVPD